jgi:hypothetical protein
MHVGVKKDTVEGRKEKAWMSIDLASETFLMALGLGYKSILKQSTTSLDTGKD